VNAIDSFFGANAQSLLVRARRAEILASNIINADTPNYKAKDLDFNAILNSSNNATSVKPVSVNSNHDKHISNSLSNSYSLQTKYRVPEHPSLDGNTVDSHIEKSQFTENAVRYQISLGLLNNKIQGLISTLRGE